MPQHSSLTKCGLPVLAIISLAAGLSALTLGCTSRGGYYLTRPQAHAPSDAIVAATPAPPRSLAMFEGDTGRVATWADLMEGVDWAEVVFIGETHDHRAAHLLQQAVVEDALASFPGTAVSFEMLERNEQSIVDTYLAGTIDLATFIEQTKSANWAGKPADGTPLGRGTWEDFYQPMIDAAKVRSAPVIAANAPREYVRQARTDGFDALRALPDDEQALFDIPYRLESGAYRERFEAVMTAEDQDPRDPEHRARVDRTYRAQQVWDATMAQSIAAALERDVGPQVTKVVHVIGGFHIDRRGGTVTQLLQARPRTRVLTIQVVPVDSRVLRQEDHGRADLVVYAAHERDARPAEAPEVPNPPVSSAESP
ncbi:MAG: ChaN family lipoprotein [Phycisphaerae bacterium]|nr:ChaN family lipoprotein [Phycisphaerae bacterium]